jgi:hypothetical protein
MVLTLWDFSIAEKAHFEMTINIEKKWQEQNQTNLKTVQKHQILL